MRGWEEGVLPSSASPRQVLAWHVDDKEREGYDVAGCRERQERSPDRYDALAEFARDLDRVPFRKDWPHEEPIESDDDINHTLLAMRLLEGQGPSFTRRNRMDL